MNLSAQDAALTQETLNTRKHHRVMVFSPWCYGHHPTYLQHLITYWQQQHKLDILNLVVSPDFLKHHRDVVDLATVHSPETIRFIAMTPQEQANLEAKSSGVGRAIEQYRLICRYASQLNATKGLILYFDSCQLPLALGAKLPCPFSGIYFRPTFHYNRFGNHPTSRKSRIQRWKEQLLLRRLLQYPYLKTLLCLDPFSVDAINQLGGTAKAVHLPDPVQVQHFSAQQVQELRERLGIQPNRKVFILFGRLDDGRKGVFQLLSAVQSLPTTLSEQLCVLLVGFSTPDGQTAIESRLNFIRNTQPIQIISHYEYVPEAEVQLYFQLTDVVLAPYQHHIGMSGILLLAAAARKPVLSSDYGLMGEMVRRHQLGLAVDTTLPEKIADALSCFLLQPAEELYDCAMMKTLVQQNSAEQFAKVIFQNV